VLVTGWGATSTQTVAADLTAKGLTAQAYYNSAYLGANPSQAAIDAAVAAAKQNDVVVVTTDNAWGDVGQQRLVAALLGSGTPVVVAALGGPYDVAYLPGVSTSLAAYDYQPPSLTALVDTLVGVGPTGRLPVTVPRADGSGTLLPRGFGSATAGAERRGARRTLGGCRSIRSARGRAGRAGWSWSASSVRSPRSSYWRSGPPTTGSPAAPARPDQ
jgi:beta-N-acetylhexosaminidase